MIMMVVIINIIIRVYLLQVNFETHKWGLHTAVWHKGSMFVLVSNNERLVMKKS